MTNKEPQMTYTESPARVPTEAERLEKSYTYHPPRGDQPKRYDAIRWSGREYAKMLFDLCPTSRELSLALTKLEEVVMWANASIARNETHRGPSDE